MGFKSACIAGVMAFGVLAGCETAPSGSFPAGKLDAKGIKPGITAAEFETRRAIPDGLVIGYQWVSDAQTLNFEFRHDVTPSGLNLSGRLLLDEAIEVDPEALEQIAAAIDASNEIEGSAAELIKDDKIGLPLNGRTDERLQLKRLKLFNEITYRPHDCSFTLGQCEFTRTEEGERPEDIVSVLSESGGIWQQLKIGDDPRGGGEKIVIEESLASFDEYGLLISVNGWEIDEDGETFYTVRRR